MDAGGLLLVLLVATIAGGIDAKQPHIVFVLADDYGWNDIGYHGSEIRTPTLDSLADKGVKLDNYYVQPTCTPTRSQLMTGRYQIRTGLQHRSFFPSQPSGLPLRFPTLADKLKESGYTTHLIGKWHLGFYRKEFTPTYRGFDTFYGKLTGSGDHFTHERCHTMTVDSYPDLVCGLDLWDNQDPVWNATGVYSTRLFTKRSQEIIERHNASRPLFMLLSFQAPHIPLQVPKRYRQPYDEEIKDRKRHTYAGMVSAMDEAVANLTESLKKNGLYNDTIIIFSTDNGGSPYQGASNWPLRGGKGTHWEGGVRGIGFVHSPLLNKTERTARGLIHVSDWFPTLVELGGGSVKGIGRLDGYNVWGTISRGEESPRKEILHNIDPLKTQFGEPKFKKTFDTSSRAAIRVGHMKLITGDPGKSSWIPPPDLSHLREFLFYRPPRNKNVWLFNITDDPLEEVDLSKEYPRIVKQLLWKLFRYSQDAVPAKFPKADKIANPAFHDGVWGPWIEKKADTETSRSEKVEIKLKKEEHPLSFVSGAWNSFYDNTMLYLAAKMKQRIQNKWFFI